jgi:hypothetical protein
LGLNLIYGAFYKYNVPKKLLRYLYDHLNKDQLEIDTVNFSGPAFKDVDNRLMSLQLVKNGMTDAVMFSPDGTNVLPARELYKKNILTLRGSFRPVTKVNMDMFEKSHKLFLEENRVNEENTKVIFEITLSNLRAEGEIDEQDFMDRADLLCSLGQTVLISNFQEYYRLVEYFSQYTKNRMGLAMGVNNLIDIFDEKYYRHLSGGILEAFGKLFFKDLKVYLYPMLDADTGELINSENLKVHPRMKELYKFFKYNGKVGDINDYDPEVLNIFSREVMQMISDGKRGWPNIRRRGPPSHRGDELRFSALDPAACRRGRVDPRHRTPRWRPVQRIVPEHARARASDCGRHGRSRGVPVRERNAQPAQHEQVD